MYIIVFTIIVEIFLLTYLQRKGSSFNKKIFVILLGIWFTIFALVFPIFNQEGKIEIGILNTLFYIIQATLFNEDLGIVQDSIVGGFSVQLILSIELILLPFITVASIFEAIKKYFSQIKLFNPFRRNIHVFDEYSEKSLDFAVLIKKNFPKDKIIFCTDSVVDGNEYLKTKAITLKEKITELDLRRSKGEVKFYCMNNSDDIVLDETINLIEKYQTPVNKFRYSKDTKFKKFIILTFTNNAETKLVLDGIDKTDIIVNIVDEIQNSTYELLMDYPLYKATTEKQIKALVIGLGDRGLNIAKSMLWCGQIPKYNFEINCIEKDMDKIKKFYLECPDIFKHLDEYKIDCLHMDIRDVEFNLEMQKKISKSNYIVIVTGNEELNIEIAKILRRHFLQTEQSLPQIYVWMEEGLKKEKIEKNDKEFGFKTFGDFTEIYKATFQNSDLDKITLKVHLTYDPDDINLVNYNSSEYNKNSSRASAMHLEYKMFPYISKDKLGRFDKEEIKEILKDDNIMSEIAKCEHRRWVAFLRTEGYEAANGKTLKIYFDKTKNIKNHEMKLHPTMVKWDELDEAEKMIENEIKISKNNKLATIDSVKNLIKEFYLKV